MSFSYDYETKSIRYLLIVNIVKQTILTISKQKLIFFKYLIIYRYNINIWIDIVFDNNYYVIIRNLLVFIFFL